MDESIFFTIVPPPQSFDTGILILTRFQFYDDIILLYAERVAGACTGVTFAYSRHRGYHDGMRLEDDFVICKVIHTSMDSERICSSEGHRQARVEHAMSFQNFKGSV